MQVLEEVDAFVHCDIGCVVANAIVQCAKVFALGAIVQGIAAQTVLCTLYAAQVISRISEKRIWTGLHTLTTSSFRLPDSQGVALEALCA